MSAAIKHTPLSEYPNNDQLWLLADVIGIIFNGFIMASIGFHILGFIATILLAIAATITFCKNNPKVVKFWNDQSKVK